MAPDGGASTPTATAEARRLLMAATVRRGGGAGQRGRVQPRQRRGAAASERADDLGGDFRSRRRGRTMRDAAAPDLGRSGHDGGPGTHVGDGSPREASGSRRRGSGRRGRRRRPTERQRRSTRKRRWSCGAVETERTLAMIKPDGLLGNCTEKIKEIILESGFDIVKEAVLRLDAERASLFYAEHSGRSFFDSLVKYMTSGPVLAMVLERHDAISHWRALIGPTDARKAKTSHPSSIRAMCGLDSEKNCVHGSDSLQSAAREISFFFGDVKSETVEHDEL